MKRITYWLDDFEHDSQTFAIEYDKEHQLVDVFLCVGGGFTCDLLKVTDHVHDDFKEMCQQKIDNKPSRWANEDYAYDSWKDQKLENGGGDDAA